ncbi:MAG: hypothetical protein R3B06_00125 [Kofleriaceae bacterium]
MRSLYLFASIVVLAACGGDGDDVVLGDPTVHVGNINVDLNDDDPPTTTMAGVVRDKAEPAGVQWDSQLTDGDCQLLTPRAPFCPAGCGSDVCVADGVCEAHGVKQDVGTVHVAGVSTTAGASEFDLRLTSGGTYQVPGTVSLAYPGVTDGGAVTVTASGSAFTPAFTATAAGISPLVVTNPELRLARDEAKAVAWAPGSATDTRIVIELDISHHGGLRGKIVCDTADDGALTLSGPMISALLDLGTAGFPTIKLTRTSVGSALTTAGRVDLTVASLIERPVTVPGVISCNDDTACTPPATCQDDLTCQ